MKHILLEKLIVAQKVKKVQNFIEPKVSVKFMKSSTFWGYNTL
jgi:hypothetical protein